MSWYEGEDIEFIILVNSKRVIEEKLLKEASQSLIKIREIELTLSERRTLLDMVCSKNCRKKGGGGEFLYNNLEREPH